VIHLLAFVWGWADATFLPIAPDVLLTLLALRSLRTALIAALFATLGAVVGGAMTYDYANLHPASSREILVAIPGVSDRAVGIAGRNIERHGAGAIVLGPPYKVYAVQWAWQHRPLLPFLLATIAARGVRYLLSSLAAALIAAPLRRRVRERTLLMIHLVFWTALYTTTFASASAAMWRVP
jgi:membrane protein YqaA with SNARE-associated domain